MEAFFALLASPGIVFGTVGGIALAAAIHWLAPVGTDMTTAGTVLIGVSAAAGLAWELFFRKGGK
jgi:hypothetical protein